ncbi:MAG: hypothetical protein QXK88_01050 [Desulfurococcaceae archaeon]
MSPAKKVAKFKAGRAPENIVVELREILSSTYSANPSEFIGESVRYTCINNICILYCGKARTNALKILYEGNWVGLYNKKVIAPSISVIKSIYSKYGVKAAIVVGEKALRAFLYGNDIFPESVHEVIPPRKWLYSVIDPDDGEVVGFVKWSRERRIYENIYDVGIFIRALN